MATEPGKAHSKEREKFELELREMNEELLLATVRQHELLEKAESAARALQENQILTTMAMQSSRMGVWELDIKTDTLSWSEELEEIFGLELGGFDGTESHYHSLIYPDDRAAVRVAVEKALAEHRSYVIEFRFFHGDGSIRWMEGRGEAVYSEAGEPIRLYGTGMDITERKVAEDNQKQAQEALILAERKAADDYHKLLQRIVPLGETLGTSHELVAIYRALRGFIRSSMPCSAFFVSFFEPETHMRTAAYAWGSQGEVDTSALPPIRLTDDGGPNSQAVFQRKPAIITRFMDVMKDRPHIVVEDDGIDPNSSLAVPMMIGNCVIGTLEVQAYEDNAFQTEHVIALDMVANLAAVAIENVRLIQVEAKARSEAEIANRAKDEFLSVLSHELRTPLNAMLGWVRMLRSDILDKEGAAKALEVIERNTRLQGSLIEDLLDVSRIISGKMRIETEALDLVAAVRTVSDTFRPLADAKGVDYEFANEPDNLFLNADPTRLQQVVSNLLQNAIKFTPAGGKVIVGVIHDGKNAVLSVADTGVGIDPQFLPFIFDRFRQADASTKRHYAGLGLGLTIVRTIVNLHGGEIAVASDGRERGSVFTVKLPLSDAYYDTEISDDLQAFGGEQAGPALAGIRILIVDDDTEGVVPLRMFLDSEEATVATAASAAEALVRLSTEKFDVLVSDIGMPDMDGYELIKTFRSLETGNSSTPAIALTAYASMDDRRDVLKAGFQTHLPKPVDFNELLDIIKGLI